MRYLRTVKGCAELVHCQEGNENTTSKHEMN